MTISRRKSTISQTSLVVLSHLHPLAYKRTTKVQVKEKSTLQTTVLIILPLHCSFVCFCSFIVLSTEDEDEEDTEIRIVKRVEDYYPESKFTARYVAMKGTQSLVCLLNIKCFKSQYGALNSSDWPCSCRERLLINEYFTLLASLEYNMQEMYKGQKLANDLVDITVTVTNDILCST